jgi:hypothetical protein
VEYSGLEWIIVDYSVVEWSEVECTVESRVACYAQYSRIARPAGTPQRPALLGSAQ